MRALPARAVPTVRCQRPELAETGRAAVMYLCFSYSTVGDFYTFYSCGIDMGFVYVSRRIMLRNL